jgi:hypothetical protein
MSMRRTIVNVAVAVALVTACGDEDAGGGPSGGFDDRAPDGPESDDGDDRTGTTAPVDVGGTRVEGTDTEAGTPPGGVGNVEGEGDVNDLGEQDG